MEEVCVCLCCVQHSNTANYPLLGDHSLLHVSWLMVVMRRVFVHDAKTIIRIGLRECLSMQLDGSPFLYQGHWEVGLCNILQSYLPFLSLSQLLLDPLLTVLCETFVYVR